MAEQKTNMRSLERAIDVLEVLEREGRSLRLSEVAQKTGLHIATAQRILGVLEDRGRVERDHAGYRPGVALVFGAHAFLASNPLVLAARPVLQELADRTGLTASLYLRSNWVRVVVARVEGSKPLRYQLPFGRRLPLHLGAGKVFAADFDDEERARFYTEAGPLLDLAGNPIEEATLTKDFAEIRRLGYYVSYEERQVGAVSITAPVRDRDHALIGAITLGAGADDIRSRDVEPLVVEVRQAAAAVGQHAIM
ncbi:IclR family transcriptional regulator [Nonomuraea sp. K274]|uniref:IclR family transcriptional regulator n=1 Tax=Nonomuraea cypriaca TaxID=1187855 RepID=A0A931AI45_9ACTN|nr:IclR family transcriptional regulator [Nonomuraea cypriaca]MBF8190754.1 IclR family transcriptional regulator [Nonomuraea cypriaca]